MLDVKDLNIEFHDHLVPETVVHQVSFHMEAGEIVGLVGESGSGKSMTALAIAGLLSRHDMKKTGEILFEGTDLLHCERSFLRELQGNDISVVFQEPMTSLNPVFTIGYQIEESLILHKGMDKLAGGRTASHPSSGAICAGEKATGADAVKAGGIGRPGADLSVVSAPDFRWTETARHDRGCDDL